MRAGQKFALRVSFVCEVAEARIIANEAIRPWVIDARSLTNDNNVPFVLLGLLALGLTLRR